MEKMLLYAQAGQRNGCPAGILNCGAAAVLGVVGAEEDGLPALLDCTADGPGMLQELGLTHTPAPGLFVYEVDPGPASEDPDDWSHLQGGSLRPAPADMLISLTSGPPWASEGGRWA